jgi:hypothetical protein
MSPLSASAVALFGVLLASAGSLGALTLAQGRARRQIQSMKTALGQPGTAALATAPSVDLSGLPEVVRRYLELALPAGSLPPALVVLEQHGQLRTSVTNGRWMSFKATHSVNPSARRFLWNANVRALPFVHLRVLDSLSDGCGSGQVLLLSAFKVGHDAGTPEMNSGSLHRFLAEAVWYPWALLPSKQLRWTPVDSNRAKATLTAGDDTVELEFRFADSGEVVGIYTPARWGSFNGGYTQLPWEGHFYDCERCDGVLMPRRGEVGWYHEGRLELVWRGSIERVAMHGADAPAG